MATVFERFTDQARRVVVLAQESSRDLGHNWIGTEHLLIALLREGEGVAPAALRSLGVSLEAAEGEIERIVPRRPGEVKGDIPFTPRSKKVLELSLREAMRLGHDYIGTEHVLLGLIRESQGVAAQVLEKLGADPGRVRAGIVELLAGDVPVGKAPGREARQALVESLTAENRTLREEIDRLRETLRLLGSPAEPGEATD